MKQRLHGALLLGPVMLLGALPRAGAETPGSGLARCAAISSAEARLKCYDALAASLGGAGRASIPSAAPPADATAAATVASPSAPPTDPVGEARNFGLSRAQLHTPPSGPASIEARVAQLSQDRSMRSLVVLDNGQSWVSTEGGGMELNTGERVTIRRAALGSFMLFSATSKHSYHVRRLR